MAARRKKQINPRVGSKAHEARMERQRARRAVDAKAKKNGGDRNRNGVADKREQRDISHNKALSRGGTNKDGYRLESRSKNRSRNYQKRKGS
tara:strand:+ start:1244 stop:1519 length:276 start_codon:yes stop_codon:yes gene_type:complete